MQVEIEHLEHLRLLVNVHEMPRQPTVDLYLCTKCTSILPSDAVAFTDAHFGQSAGNVLIGGVGCTGTESSLLSCSYTSGSCQHSDDAGVRCQSELHVYAE